MREGVQTPPALPVVILGGYLGAGKTTTVNHLLRHAQGRRIAVLVNDFGELAIDADLIEGQPGKAGEEGVVALAGGCVCCSFGGDLLGAVRMVAARNPQPDVMLIETSGVGLPAAVARVVRLAAEVQVQAIVVLADAETLAERMLDRFVGDVVREQLLQADLLVLNKMDLVSPAAVQLLTDRLATLGVAAPRLTIERGRLPPELVFDDAYGAGDGAVATDGKSGHSWQPQAGPAASALASARFESVVHSYAEPVDVAALAAALTAPGSRVVRAKGVLTNLSGQRQLLQVVGSRSEVSDAPAVADSSMAAVLGRLLVISVRTFDVPDLTRASDKGPRQAAQASSESAAASFLKG